LERFGCPIVSPSETIEDGLALLRAAEQMPRPAQGQDAGPARSDPERWRLF